MICYKLKIDVTLSTKSLEIAENKMKALFKLRPVKAYLKKHKIIIGIMKYTGAMKK